jgi:intein/homing endonuclease
MPVIKSVSFPAKSKRLAELIGILLGDGNIQEYVIRGKGVATYCIRISGHLTEDKKYHENYVVPLCIKLFKVTPKIYFHKLKKERFIHLASKRLVNFFKKQGFPPGNKIHNKVTIPKWIFRNSLYLRACLRGLVDTDGSVYLAGKWIQICFKNFNLVLLSDFRKALIQLGFYASNITWNKVYISRKADVRKFYKEIGFSNTHHIERYNRFCSPVV